MKERMERYSMNTIPVIIPSLEPDERLSELLRRLAENGIGPIVLLDDGSGLQYQPIFERAREQYHCIVLRHAVNLGKGRALKDAFNFCLNTWPDLIGCITADSDGQHTPESISKCTEALRVNPNDLILGVRNFDAEGVPDKSRIGNKVTRKVCRYLCGVSVTDTQTGLRGIPKEFMKDLMVVPGERFEFETRMLIETKDRYRITEIPIETVYDSKENHASHFDPFRDSIRIYRIFGGMFGRYVFSSLSSSVLDLLLFSVFCGALAGMKGSLAYISVATVLARVISAIYNYLVNYSLVFKSRSGRKTSLLKYALLAAIQMLCSAALVTLGMMILGDVPELMVKIPVDMALFFISYAIQREFVYRS